MNDAGGNVLIEREELITQGGDGAMQEQCERG